MRNGPASIGEATAALALVTSTKTDFSAADFSAADCCEAATGAGAGAAVVTAGFFIATGRTSRPARPEEDEDEDDDEDEDEDEDDDEEDGAVDAGAAESTMSRSTGGNTTGAE